MNCSHCYEEVPSDSPFCPKCGARLSAPLMGPPEAADPTYLDVARANLLRMRGDWDAAHASAISILRQYPHSPTAHSLLGDILADQGRLDEAAQWYRMALELDEGNIADKRKLQRIHQTVREAEERRAQAEAKPQQVSPWRVIGLASALFLAGVVVAGFLFRQASENGEAVVPRVPAAPNQPAGSAPLVGAPPGATAPVAETERETFLLATILARSQDLSRAGMRVSAAIVDESGNRGLLVVNATGLDGGRPDWTRSVYYTALNLANSAMSVDRALDQIAVRVVMDLEVEGQGRRREQAFLGTLDRKDAPSGAPATRFTSAWWRPGIQPVPDASSAPAAPGP